MKQKCVDCLHSNINSIFFCQSEIVSHFSEKACSLAQTLYCGENIAVGYGLQYILNETLFKVAELCYYLLCDLHSARKMNCIIQASPVPFTCMKPILWESFSFH